MIKTKEWSLASFLLSKEARLLGTFVNSADEVVFQFAADPRISELEKAFYSNGDVSVNVHDFISAQKRVKGLVYRNRGGNHG